MVDAAEMVDRDVRVDLGGREAFVTEKLLYRAQVGARVEQMRREGVS